MWHVLFWNFCQKAEAACCCLAVFVPGQFLHGRRLSEDYQGSSPACRIKEALYQSQWEAKLSAVEDEEERHFCMLLESLGASSIFEE